MSFSLDDKRYLLAVARHAVEDALRSRKPAHRETVPEKLNFDSGVFVTLWQGKELRGCIGYIEAVAPLIGTIREVAEKAALEDPRFAPVAESDLTTLDIEISVLSPKKKISSIAEIEIGTHGLIVATDRRRGLLLPQVPLEYGWDRLTFIAQTCRKAGLPADAWKSPQTQLFTFSAEVFRESECEPI